MGIDTLVNFFLSYKQYVRGNEEKPEWALTHKMLELRSFLTHCGNEEKPEWALTRCQ